MLFVCIVVDRFVVVISNIYYIAYFFFVFAYFDYVPFLLLYMFLNLSFPAENVRQFICRSIKRLNSRESRVQVHCRLRKPVKFNNSPSALPNTILDWVDGECHCHIVPILNIFTCPSTSFFHCSFRCFVILFTKRKIHLNRMRCIWYAYSKCTWLSRLHHYYYCNTKKGNFFPLFFSSFLASYCVCPCIYVFFSPCVHLNVYVLFDFIFLFWLIYY